MTGERKPLYDRRRTAGTVLGNLPLIERGLAHARIS